MAGSGLHWPEDMAATAATATRPDPGHPLHTQTQAKAHPADAGFTQASRCPPPKGLLHSQPRGPNRPSPATELGHSHCPAKPSATRFPPCHHSHAHACTHTCMRRHTVHIHVHVCTRTGTHPRACAGMLTGTYLCSCAHTRGHACTRAYTCTHTGGHAPSPKWLIIAVKEKSTSGGGRRGSLLHHGPWATLVQCLTPAWGARRRHQGADTFQDLPLAQPRS